MIKLTDQIHVFDVDEIIKKLVELAHTRNSILLRNIILKNINLTNSSFAAFFYRGNIYSNTVHTYASSISDLHSDLHETMNNYLRCVNEINYDKIIIRAYISQPNRHVTWQNFMDNSPSAIHPEFASIFPDYVRTNEPFYLYKNSPQKIEEYYAYIEPTFLKYAALRYLL